MILSIKEAFNRIINHIAKEKKLDGLVNTPSSDGKDGYDSFQEHVNEENLDQIKRWKLLCWLVAFSTSVHEQKWNVFKEKVDRLINSSKPGSLKWYERQILSYKDWNDEDGNPVIQYVALLDNKKDDKVIIKLAGKDRSNLYPALPPKKDNPSEEEKKAYDQKKALRKGFEEFERYFKLNIKMPGIRADIESKEAYTVKADYRIIYDPKLFKDREEAEADLGKRISDAVNEYQKSKLPFNGNFSLQHLSNVLQRVEGILNPIALATYLQEPKSEENKDPEIKKTEAIMTHYTADSGYLRVGIQTLTYAPYELEEYDYRINQSLERFPLHTVLSDDILNNNKIKKVKPQAAPAYNYHLAFALIEKKDSYAIQLDLSKSGNGVWLKLAQQFVNQLKSAETKAGDTAAIIASMKAEDLQQISRYLFLRKAREYAEQIGKSDFTALEVSIKDGLLAKIKKEYDNWLLCVSNGLAQRRNEQLKMYAELLKHLRIYVTKMMNDASIPKDENGLLMKEADIAEKDDRKFNSVEDLQSEFLDLHTQLITYNMKYELEQKSTAEKPIVFRKPIPID
ncbi:MAG: hypothetical protein MI784_12090 [Cytophagales bacterium]|nr:hypothetical protein [Cytophagales bacterium]